MGLFDRKRRVRRVFWNDPDGRRLAATFWLEGDRVEARYESEAARRMFEVGGIVPPNQAEELRPADGRRFYDVLSGALSQTSRMTVEDGRE